MDENSTSPPDIDYFDHFFGAYPDHFYLSEERFMVYGMLFEYLNCSRCLKQLDQLFNSHSRSIDLTIFQFLNYAFNVFVFGFLSGFGVLSNIINFIVFYRQGILSDSCTVSLVGITVADFLCRLISLFNCVMTELFDLDGFVNFKFSYSEQMNIAALKDLFNTHKQLFIQIACCISAFLSLERFYSVAYPFKVKTIFTSTRTCLVLCVIFLVSFLLSVPSNFSYLLVWSKQQGNTSAFERVPNPVISQNAFISEHFINSFVLRVVYVLIITVLNFIIFWKVRASTKFRKSSSKIQKNISAVSNTLPKTTSDEKKANTQRRKIDRKEIKLLRMVWVILSLLVVSYIPGFIADIIFYGTSFQENLSIFSIFLLHDFKILFETVNSSTNISFTSQ